MTKSLNGDISSSWLAEMLFVKLVLDCTESYTPTFPHRLLEQSLRVLWGAVSWAPVFILFQIKLNSQFSSCASVLANSIHRLKQRETKMIQSFPIKCDSCPYPSLFLSNNPLWRQKKKKKNFIAWDSHRSTWTSEYPRPWGKKYMEKCIITARHFGNIMKTIISIYYKKY